MYSSTAQPSSPIDPLMHLRFVVLNPPPHETVHGDRASHSAQLASVGHSSILHGRDSTDGPNLAHCPSTLQSRDRFCIPPPQVASHSSNRDVIKRQRANVSYLATRSIRDIQRIGPIRNRRFQHCRPRTRVRLDRYEFVA